MTIEHYKQLPEELLCPNESPVEFREQRMLVANIAWSFSRQKIVESPIYNQAANEGNSFLNYITYAYVARIVNFAKKNLEDGLNNTPSLSLFQELEDYLRPKLVDHAINKNEVLQASTFDLVNVVYHSIEMIDIDTLLDELTPQNLNLIRKLAAQLVPESFYSSQSDDFSSSLTHFKLD